MSNKHGILLINLGTPADISHLSIKKYLTEFLHDRHVVDLHPLFWYPILHGIVLPKRVPYIAKHYQKIWLNNLSPLMYYTQQLNKNLQAELTNSQCEFAMTYGEPSLQSALIKLSNCETITVIPLFPQYSTTTTQASLNKLKAIIKNKSQSVFNYINDYSTHPRYIEALFLSIKQSFLTQGEPEILLLSFHGIPIRYIHKRQDVYTQHCHQTTQLLIEKCRQNGINVPIKMTFQSKFGKGKWTEPNISDVLQNLAEKGIKNVQVMCPGFAADCIETLYEIDDENREIFLNAGGEYFYYIPALNASGKHVKLLKELLDEPTQSLFEAKFNL